jgi:hypothetical protein
MCGDSPSSSFLIALIETTQPLCINEFSIVALLWVRRSSHDHADPLTWAPTIVFLSGLLPEYHQRQASGWWRPLRQTEWGRGARKPISG